ncbi:hypothetical protein GCM10023165_43760 [Variovorax defluvii]|uniref:MatE family transporter n=1 Tax=Variovorax defluvii TaxID=913761 RepID=A0ABP8I8A8_9BURK
MATSSILGGEQAPAEHDGANIDALGPSDSSDSGSDVQTDRNRSVLPDEAAEGAWPVEHRSSTDAAGTGERASADPAPPQEDGDILPDRVGILPPGSGDDTVRDLGGADALAGTDESEDRLRDEDEEA